LSLEHLASFNNNDNDNDDDDTDHHYDPEGASAVEEDLLALSDDDIFDLIGFEYLPDDTFSLEMHFPDFSAKVGIDSTRKQAIIRSAKPATFFFPQLANRSPTQPKAVHDCMCIICQDEYVVSSMVVELSCSHRYHCDCIVEWLQHNATCCICRQRV